MDFNGLPGELPLDVAIRIHKTEDGCWLFRNRANSYGLYQKQPAHRYVYELLVGPIPETTEIDHLCRVKGCINPEHLEPVTRSVNQERVTFRRRRDKNFKPEWRR